MSSVYHLIYVSEAVKPMNDGQLRELLYRARRNNTRNGITGLLLYKDGRFIQILEGRRAVVEQTFERICRDDRHDSVRVIFKGRHREREFSDWSMGFEHPEEAAFAHAMGLLYSFERVDEFEHVTSQSIVRALKEIPDNPEG